MAGVHLRFSLVPVRSGWFNQGSSLLNATRRPYSPLPVNLANPVYSPAPCSPFLTFFRLLSGQKKLFKRRG